MRKVDCRKCNEAIHEKVGLKFSPAFSLFEIGFRSQNRPQSVSAQRSQLFALSQLDDAFNRLIDELRASGFVGFAGLENPVQFRLRATRLECQGTFNFRHIIAGGSSDLLQHIVCEADFIRRNCLSKGGTR